MSHLPIMKQLAQEAVTLIVLHSTVFASQETVKKLDRPFAPRNRQHPTGSGTIPGSQLERLHAER